jgi:hypothetical protein
MKKRSKPRKKSPPTAKQKPAKRRAFPYLKVAELWAAGKTIPEIAKSVGRVGKGDDPCHGMRVALTRMHKKGYKNAKGDVVKLPHRITRAALRNTTAAGKKSKTKGSPKERQTA